MHNNSPDSYNQTTQSRIILLHLEITDDSKFLICDKQGNL